MKGLKLGTINFQDENSNKVFKSLSKNELQELENDLSKVLKRLKTETSKANYYEGHLEFNQRLGSRKFNGILHFDLSDNNIILIFENLRELDIDGYLDSINNSKGLVVKGYKPLNIYDNQ